MRANENEIEEVLQEYFKKNLNLSLIQDIKSGKDASLFKVEMEGKYLALKVYHNLKYGSFARYLDYLDQEKFPTSLKRAIKAKNDYGKKMVQMIRSNQEFTMLKNLYLSNVSLPKPIAWTAKSVLMEYIGDLNPAPRLLDTTLEEYDLEPCLDQILDSVEIMLRNNIVHADLSPYNILWWKKQIYIIDFPQAVDTRSGLEATEFLIRDLNNILDYFENRLTFNRDEIINEFIELI